MGTLKTLGNGCVASEGLPSGEMIVTVGRLAIVSVAMFGAASTGLLKTRRGGGGLNFELCGQSEAKPFLDTCSPHTRTSLRRTTLYHLHLKLANDNDFRRYKTSEPVC